MTTAGERPLGYRPGSPTGERLLPHQLGRRVHFVTHLARYRFAASVANPPGRALDSGCGTGYGTHLLAERGFDVLGVDIAPEAIEYARTMYAHPRATFEVRDALDIRRVEEFDLVTSFEVIEHLPDARAYLAAVVAAMRPNGLLVISTPNRDRSQWQDGRPLNPCHHTEYKGAEFRTLLERAGFEVEKWLGQRLGRPTRRMLHAVGAIAGRAAQIRGIHEAADWPAWWERAAVRFAAPLAARSTWSSVERDNAVRELPSGDEDFFVVVARKRGRS